MATGRGDRRHRRHALSASAPRRTAYRAWPVGSRRRGRGEKEAGARARAGYWRPDARRRRPEGERSSGPQVGALRLLLSGAGGEVDRSSQRRSVDPALGLPAVPGCRCPARARCRRPLLPANGRCSRQPVDCAAWGKFRSTVWGYSPHHAVTRYRIEGGAVKGIVSGGSAGGGPALRVECSGPGWPQRRRSRGNVPRSGTGSSALPFRTTSKWRWGAEEDPDEPERPMTGRPCSSCPAVARTSERWA